MKSIYVGNLPFSAKEDEIRDLFAVHGEVQVVKFVMDRETGRFRGFGFVEMEDAGAAKAIEALDARTSVAAPCASTRPRSVLPARPAATR